MGLKVGRHVKHVGADRRAVIKIGCAAVILALAMSVYKCRGHVNRRVSICRYLSVSAFIFCLVKINKKIDVLCDLFLHISYIFRK
jgi:hypothetical protein